MTADLWTKSPEVKPDGLYLMDGIEGLRSLPRGSVDMLPSDFPSKSTVFYYFQIWTEEKESGMTLLDEVLKKIGRPMAYRRWKARSDEFQYHRRPECTER